MIEIPKAYEPAAVEEGWYSKWLDARCFEADPDSPKPAYSIVIPPPNVTGVLTLGHVLNNTIQDILCRRARMKGREVLWLPGTDHAGLATQTAVEKALRKPTELPATVREVLESRADLWDKEGGKPKGPLNRHTIDRETMLELVWAWTRDRGGIIIQQLKKLGCSCDWGRERFTMDPGYQASVLQAFVALYDKGYIYRGKRMVNWCPVSLTAISNEEVIATPQKSTLYTMRYEVVEEPGTFLEIATTRPETLMGDTGVAVSPHDPRYARFVGLHCWRPFPRAKIPVIADEHIDPKFGTGVLKVTPAHDRADFDIGLRHNLPIVDILHPDARINCPEVPELDGLDRFVARKKAVEMLTEAGLLVREEPYENNVGFSERGQVPIEPRLSEQWFLDYRKMLGGTMIDEALRIVRERVVRFHPDRWEKVYNHWLENIVDWCLSRQVVWGHRIPVWYLDGEVRCQVESPGDGWNQDPDTLDTWASSWLWAYATMDEPVRKKFYPTSALVTGPDIIFLWVARMIIAGLEFNPTESAHDPTSMEYLEANRAFDDVYFTGLIRDRQGRKMSKSLGNSPDPLDLIARFGADGLRFGLMRIAPQGQDIRFDEKQVEEGRNFANKLWNAARFRQMQGASLPDPQLHGLVISSYGIDILSKLADLIDAVDKAYDAFRFNEIGQRLYDFFWSEYCNWYMEATKSEILSDDPAIKHSALAVMDYVLSRLLRLLHPYMPHITEELWERLGFRTEYLGKSFLMYAPVPEADHLEHIGHDRIAEARRVTDAVYETTRMARNLRTAYQIPSNKRVRFVLRAQESWVKAHAPILAQLASAELVEIDPLHTPEKGEPTAISPMGELYLPLAGLIDLDAERDRLTREIAKLEKDLAAARSKLANANFVANAPAEVVEENRRRESENSEKLEQLGKLLSQL